MAGEALPQPAPIDPEPSQPVDPEPPSFRELVTRFSSYSDVANFLMGYLKFSVPFALLGSAHNWRTLSGHVDVFVRKARKHHRAWNPASFDVAKLQRCSAAPVRYY